MASRTAQRRRTSRPPGRHAQVRPETDLVEEEYEEEAPPGPRWPWIVGLALSLLGLADAAYLTYDHYSGTAPAACAEHGTINCALVTTSVYSKIHGVPVVNLGLAFFVVMVVLQLPAMWRSYNPVVRIGRLVWCLVGVGTAVWLVYAELVQLQHICLYCTAVHVITLLLFIVTAFATAATAPLPGER
jgi:uncharacterized membrane protein